MALSLRREFGFDSRPERLRSVAGEHMRIKSDIRKTVVFVGHMDTNGPFRPVGTAFLFMHDRLLYLVTARHIAEQFGDEPFYIRMNGENGGVINAHMDLLSFTEHEITWFFPEDTNVDLAVLPFAFDIEGFGADFLILSTHHAAILEMAPSAIGCGDFCYVVGLFSLHSGKGRVLPVVHTGHIAMMPDRRERIETQDWRKPGSTIDVEGYLVEVSNLQGLSGSPVMVRPSRIMTAQSQKGTPVTGVVGAENYWLLGVWQGSWEGRPIGLQGPRVPVGMGVVTPVEKLIELLDSSGCRSNRRDYWQKNWSAKPDGIDV